MHLQAHPLPPAYHWHWLVYSPHLLLVAAAEFVSEPVFHICQRVQLEHCLIHLHHEEEEIYRVVELIVGMTEPWIVDLAVVGCTVDGLIAHRILSCL